MRKWRAAWMDRLQWIKLQPAVLGALGPLRGGLLAHAQLAKTLPGRARLCAGDREARAQEAARDIAPWWKPRRWAGRAAAL
jgi:malonyl-CoA O-methyltransferase